MDEGSRNRIGSQGRTQTVPVSSSRRRLTAAAFTAPLIATLSAPRSVAAASLTVTERLDDQWNLAITNEPAIVGNDPMDGIQWARDLQSQTQIYAVRLKNGNGEVLPAFYDGTNYRSVYWPGDTLDVKTSGQDAPQPNGFGYKLLFFTYDGQSVIPAASGTPLTASCWASLGITPL